MSDDTRSVVVRSRHEKPGQRETAAALMREIREMMSACMQCGTCTGSCPNAPDMDATPRRMWRMVQAGRFDRIWETRTFALCSACYTCTLRCPRGLPLTDAMAALKRLAALVVPGHDRGGVVFARCFLNNVRKTGRLHESAFMTSYLLSLGSPGAMLRFSPLGVRFLLRGKMGPPFVPGRRGGPVDVLFAEAARREGW
ncbi:MAG: 4Fe-4S dicluster domain-containing protein [Desulfatibacillaceae bacterium]